jgi:hypothetical protein
VTESIDHLQTSTPEPGIPVAFPCRRCRYEIRGIALDGVCPECGEPIWRTLSEHVDLSASMIDAETCRRTGRLLPVVAAIVAIVAILAALPPATWPWSGPDSRLATPLSSVDDSSIWTKAASAAWLLIGLAAAAAAIGLRDGSTTLDLDDVPQDFARPLRRPRILLRLGAGLAFATALSLLLPIAVQTGVAGPLALASTGVLLLAGGLLADRLGPGSRRWRSGGSARQSPYLVVGSLIAAICFSLASGMFEVLDRPEGATIAGLLAAATMLLVVIGGLYLAANVLWISGDLRRRRPRLERMLSDLGGQPGPGTTPTDGTDRTPGGDAPSPF